MNDKNILWYDNFIESLHKKFPKKSKLVEELVKLLDIESVLAYRRLRKEVYFSSSEIVKISSAWEISMDKIIGVNNDKINFQMFPVNFYNPQKADLDYLQTTIQLFNRLKDNSFSEYIEVCNKLPRSLVVRFPHVRNFYKFMWMYKYDIENQDIPYSKVIFSEQMQKIMEDYVNSTMNIKEISYIFDKFLFNHLIEEIHYFHEIKLITDTEKESIKNDLLKLLNFLLESANIGKFSDTQNKLNLYVSHINIDTNYSCFSNEEYKIFRVHLFGEYESKNYNPEIVLNFMKLLQLKKNSAVLISGSDKKSRIEYFAKQREIIEKL